MLSDEPTSCKSRGLSGLDDNLVPQCDALVWLKSQVSAIINFSRRSFLSKLKLLHDFTENIKIQFGPFGLMK